MKRFLFAVLFPFSIICVFFSCEKSLNDASTQNEVVYVDLKISLEKLDLISEEPLTRADNTNNAIFGISIWQLRAPDAYGNEEPVPYCYGLFDDFSKLTVKFIKGKKYQIGISYLPNGKNEILYDSGIMEWGEPFCRFPSTPHSSPITFNTMVYDNEDALYCLNCGYVAMKDGAKGLAPIDFYAYEGVVTITDAASLSIKLLRHNAGFVILFEEGSVKYDDIYIQIPQYRNFTVKASDMQFEIPKIYIFQEEEKWDISIGTPNEPGLFFSGEIILKRNTKTTYRLKLEAQEIVSSLMGITIQDEWYTENGGYLL
jgi:hypothetical protein